MFSLAAHNKFVLAFNFFIEIFPGKQRNDPTNEIEWRDVALTFFDNVNR